MPNMERSIEFNPEKIKAFFLDMDGVMYSGSSEIGNLHDIFQKIEKAGILPLFGTNNASRTPAEYVEKMREFGVETKPDQFFTSSVGTVHILRTHYPSSVRLHVFGSAALKKFLVSEGFSLVDDHANVVIASLDKEMTYQKVADAMRNVEEGADFIATNTDSTLASEKGWLPGGGVMVNTVETCTGKKPFVIGKPNTIMIDMARNAYNLKPEEILVVGDRYETDILCGINDGAQTALVLTGYETRESVLKYAVQPNIICKDFDAVVDLIINERNNEHR